MTPRLFIVVSVLLAGLFAPDITSGQVTDSESHHPTQVAEGKPVPICGICRDEAQRPLGGVAIGLWKMPRAERGVRISEAVTGDDGRFCLESLPSSPADSSAAWKYVLVATLAGRESQVLAIPPASRGEQQLNIPVSATLKGRVFGPDDRPVTGAIIWAGDVDETLTFFGVRSAKTDADGTFAISDVRGADGVPLHGSIVVLHPEFAQQRLNYPDDPGQLGVRVKEGSLLQGHVVDGVSGLPVPHVVVTARYVIRSDRVVGFLSPDELKDTREALTDELGEFRFTGLGGNVRYMVQVVAQDRVPISDETVITTPGGTDTLPELKVVSGGVIEGRILTLKGDPLSRDPHTQGRLSVKISQNQNSVVDVDDSGRFRVRVTPGRHRMQIQNLAIWERTWRRGIFENGIEVADGQTVQVTFRVGEKVPPKPRPARVDQGKVPLPEPVAAERWAANEIRELGGWYQLDAGGHVVEVNMVYCDHEGNRYDNGFTESDDGLRVAASFPRLERLLLHKGQATDDAMHAVAEMKELKMLFVWDAEKLTDAGIRQLEKLEKLENVHLGNGGLGDATLEVLSGLPNIQTLSLQGNAFTDNGLAHIARMEQLESLWIGLGKTKLSDAGLRHLVGMRALRTLDLQRTGVTDDGIAALRRELPGLQQVFK